MSLPAERRTEVVDMVHYLRDLVSQIDDAVGGWTAKRQGFAVQLAAMEAATDPAVLEVASDYEARVAEDRPYDDAEDAASLLTEAHRRFVT